MTKKFSKLLIIAVIAFALAGCSKKAEMVKTEADAATTASIVNDGAALVKAVSEEGAWIAATLNDIVLTEDLIVSGEFVAKEKTDRKLALYDQDENHKITAQYTLTAPKMIVKSPNFRITGGTFKGDVYVQADGFWLDKSATVDGDIYFSTQAQLDAFTMDETAKLVGKKIVVDAVTTASIVNEASALVKAVSADGAWLAAVITDVVVAEDLVIDGEFTHNDAIDRKLALYDQDDNYKITAQYTVTAPKMIVKSPNFRITGGTFVGDVYVEADGFWLDKSATVEGNIYFTTQAQLDAFKMDDTAKLVGEKSVK